MPTLSNCESMVWFSLSIMTFALQSMDKKVIQIFFSPHNAYNNLNPFHSFSFLWYNFQTKNLSSSAEQRKSHSLKDLNFKKHLNKEVYFRKL